MADDLDREELDRVLSELSSSDSSVREQAMLGLKRLVNGAIAEDEDPKLTLTARMDAWSVKERELLNLPEIARALINAMDDAAPRIRGFAAIDLRDIDDPEAESALIAHLRSDPHGQVRMLCMASLRSKQPPPPLEVIVEALNDPLPNVVYPACMALGERGDKRAVEPLRNLLSHPSWSVRFHTCEALVKLGAVDQVVVQELEFLSGRPEAAQHNDIVWRAYSFQSDLEETPREAPTTDVVLEWARLALLYGRDAT